MRQNKKVCMKTYRLIIVALLKNDYSAGVVFSASFAVESIAAGAAVVSFAAGATSSTGSVTSISATSVVSAGLLLQEVKDTAAKNAAKATNFFIFVKI